MKSLNYGGSLKSAGREIFYVSIENIEQIENNSYEIFFDGIQHKQMTLISTSSLLESYNKITPYLFKINVKKEKYQEIIELQNNAFFKRRWFELIIIDNKTELPVSIIIDNESEEDSKPVEKFISSIKQIHSQSSTNKRLNKYFSWESFNFSNREEIEKILSKPYNRDENFIHKLNIYNVGQGSLSAITDEKNVPLLYYDLGGGFAWNKSTYLNTLKLCFSYTKTIIISHWDNDHLETAKRYFKSDPSILNDVTWIVPEQKITTSYFKLAAKMRATGNLIIWPNTLRGKLSFWFGELIKCNGPDKNHSGIALVVISPENYIEKVLCPGDAAYKYIPWIRRMKFDGLVATHHGANFDDENAPVPNCKNGNIAYSYGFENTYFHPRDSAVDAHVNFGWTNRRDTVDGNISFTQNTAIKRVPCRNRNCNLIINQAY
jgi:beta-lactamase superfamily II metal-dependent hydrolase